MNQRCKEPKNKKTIDSEPLNHYNIIRFNNSLNQKRGDAMTYLKHFTIYIPLSMKADLDMVKNNYFCKNDMMKDLIIRGLHSIKVETELNIVETFSKKEK